MPNELKQITLPRPQTPPTKYLVGDEWIQQVAIELAAAQKEIIIISGDLSELSEPIYGHEVVGLCEASVGLSSRGQYLSAAAALEEASKRMESFRAQAEERKARFERLPRFLGTLYNNLGYCWLQAGAYEKAVVSLKQALAYDPRTFFANNNLAGTYERLGDVVMAKQHYARELEVNAKHPTAHQSLQRLSAPPVDISGLF